MSEEQLPDAPPDPQPSSSSPGGAFMDRLGLGGKVLGIGAAVGILSTLLPAVTVSLGPMSDSVMVMRDWRGIICLLGYLASIVFVVVLAQPGQSGNKGLGWAALGTGGLVALMALFLLIGATSDASNAGRLGGMGMSVSIGIGTILNLLAAGTVAAGGFLKARETKAV